LDALAEGTAAWARERKEHLDEVTAQLQEGWQRVDAAEAGVPADRLDNLAERATAMAHAGETKLLSIWEEGELGPQHPEVLAVIASNVNLRTTWNMLISGAEPYRKGQHELEEAEKLFRSEDYPQARERWMDASTAFLKCMEVLKERIEKAEHEAPWNAVVSLEGTKEFYLPMAEQGNGFAQVLVGWCCTNLAEEMYWYWKAADQGNAAGQCFLGEMYENGRGVAKNDAEAAKWYRKAAEQGNALGQENLRRMQQAGRGVVQSNKGRGGVASKAEQEAAVRAAREAEARARAAEERARVAEEQARAAEERARAAAAAAARREAERAAREASQKEGKSSSGWK